MNPQGGKIAPRLRDQSADRSRERLFAASAPFPLGERLHRGVRAVSNGAHDDQVDAMTQMILRWHMAPPQERVVLWSDLLGDDYRDRDSTPWFQIGRY